MTSERVFVNARQFTPFEKNLERVLTSDPEFIFHSLIVASLPPVAIRSFILKSTQSMDFWSGWIV